MISPLLDFVQMLPSLFEGWVSWRRVLRFIREPPRNISDGGSTMASSAEPPSKSRETAADTIVSLNSVVLQWSEREPLLRGVTFSLAPGDVAVVLGPAGSGKSSLLRSLLPLGEPRTASGSLLLSCKKMSFCAQTPWFLTNESVRSNILLDNHFDQSLYDAVLDCCALSPDLAGFDEGDNKIIADYHGSQLSGGQRKRIALARALYSEPDLLVLDDVFAGLDTQTRSLVQHKLFGIQGWIVSRAHMAAIVASSIG